MTLRVAASLVKATPLAWGWRGSWQLTGRQASLRLGCWDQWALLGNPLGLGQARQQGLYQEQRLLIDQFGDQEAWAASLLACGPSLPASPVPRTSAIERRAHNGGKLRKVWIKYPHQSCSTHHPGLLGGLGEPVPPPKPWGCGSSSPKILQRGRYLMLATHGHTEARSTERQQHISESDTENTASIFFFFVQNM